jgi:serine/threonine protein kinase
MARTCSQCGQALAEDAISTCCPACLLRLGLDLTTTDSDDRVGNTGANRLSGTRVAHYEILERLGRGGMGEVYRARDHRLERDVAVKWIRPEAGDDQRKRARFAREARALAAINHPSVIKVHAVEELGDTQFLVMEIVKGQSLEELIPERGFERDELLALAQDLVDAVAAAHRQGVLHRDLKPRNVMLSDAGQLKVLDFGLAKVKRKADAATVDATSLTREGVVVGTAPYMSPEQAKGESVDQRSDLFSLGALLYEMATGRQAFAGGSEAEVISAVLRDDPPPLGERRPDLPPAFAELVARALEKRPERRFSSAATLAANLLAIASHDPRARDIPTEPARIEQQIHYCTTPGGFSIAYATSGNGPPLVRALGWFTHLEREWRWPAGSEVWRHLSQRHTLLRYDGRGLGLSERTDPDLSHEARLEDLETVVEAAGLDRFALMGLSGGGQTAIAYAARHPERVTHLVLHGSYVASARGEDERKKWRHLHGLIEAGWGGESPVFGQMFAQMLLGAGAATEDVDAFTALQRASASPATAARYLAATGGIDVTEHASRIVCPTLITHRRQDPAIPFTAAQEAARLVSHAELEPLHGDCHWLIFEPGAATAYVELLESFLTST